MITRRRFAPVMLPGCVLWLDASVRRSLWQDSARTTAWAASGDPVGAWDDLSGQGNHATQSNSARRPAGVDVSGRIWVDADGSDDALELPAMGTINACTVALAVAMDTTAPSFQSILTIKPVLGTVPFYEMLFSNSSPSYTSWLTCFEISSGNAPGINPSRNTNAHGIVVAYNGSGGNTASNYTVTYDRASSAVTVPGGAYSRTGTEIPSLFGRVPSAGSAPALPANAKMAEVVVYDRELTSTETQILAAYLAGKWGLP